MIFYVRRFKTTYSIAACTCGLAHENLSIHCLLLLLSDWTKTRKKHPTPSINYT
jgi:hypothetical protein